MRNKDQIQAYEKIRDILIFIANANKPVSLTEILDCVTEQSRTSLTVQLRKLAQAGYVFEIRTLQRTSKTNMFFVPTDKTKELYGDRAKPKKRPSENSIEKPIFYKLSLSFETKYFPPK